MGCVEGRDGEYPPDEPGEFQESGAGVDISVCLVHFGGVTMLIVAVIFGLLLILAYDLGVYWEKRRNKQVKGE